MLLKQLSQVLNTAGCRREQPGCSLLWGVEAVRSEGLCEEAAPVQPHTSG